jgi:hypothetical protein
MNRGTSAGGGQEGCASRFTAVRDELSLTVRDGLYWPFVLSLSKHPLPFILLPFSFLHDRSPLANPLII